MFPRSLFTSFSLLFFWVIFFGHAQAFDDGCLNARDAAKTLSACNEAIAASPEDYRLYLSRGSAFSKGGQQDQAISDFTVSIRLNPKSEDAYYERGIALRAKGDFRRSTDDMRQVVALNPNSVRGYVGIGSNLLRVGEFDKAIVELNKAISIDPNYEGAFELRAHSWLEKREYQLALADVNEQIRIAPKGGGYFLRSHIRIVMQDFDQAIADANQAILLTPNWSFNYVARGTAWRMKGDLDNAILDMNRAVELRAPTDLTALNGRGDVLRYRGDLSNAILDYKKSLSSLPDNLPALTGLGLTYEKQGDLKQARVQFELAVASQSEYRFRGDSRLALETARARLAAYASPTTQPAIVSPPRKATSVDSIPTPAVLPPSDQTRPPSRSQGRRIALVIGNSAYQNVPALVNPQKDATAIAASLRAVGFEVTASNNANRAMMIDNLRKFANEAEKADWAVVYYAGHGMEVSGVNYLVPIDAKVAVDRDIQYEAVPLAEVLKAADTAKKIKLVMLDACRDNPFTPRQTAPPETVTSKTATAGTVIATRSSNGRGLAEVKVTGATLVVYAAKDGEVALDGEGGNSPFAVAVAQRLATPGVEINKIFRLVRDDVMEATAGRQEPYTYGSLPGKEDFFFVAK
jgi:tetratricopeptide (TPR) repeat protein